MSKFFIKCSETNGEEILCSTPFGIRTTEFKNTR